ncbi:tetratricopeptide repeat-containing sensor histidine kinase [Aquimarina litoralis]|uniref:tetratricopeptide repeat-containing sensor histidine kinase n=1 Tax=Aquimarina litoralis TaxID=584605 RepID=UPI001C58908A|nr:sensor histidine kinase [Aquimarina litoralis]MBW1295909.1 hypothetical protein [Aquimarina litoralis]
MYFYKLYNLSLIVTLCFCFNSNAQQAEKLDIYNIYKKDLLKSIDYCDSILKSKTSNISEIKRYKALAQMQAISYDSAYTTLRSIKETDGNNKDRIKQLLVLSGLEVYKGQFNESFETLAIADSLSQSIDDNELKAEVLLAKSTYNNQRFSQYDVASGYLFDALEVHDDITTSVTKRIYIKLAYLLQLNDFASQGYEYLDKVISQAEKEEDFGILAQAHSIYVLLLHDESSIKHFKKAEYYATIQKNKLQLGYLYVNQANVLASDEIQDYVAALDYYHKARILFEKLNSPNGTLGTLINLSWFFSGEKDYQDSAYYYTSSLEKMAKAYKVENIHHHIYYAYSDFYELKGDYKKAYEYYVKANNENEKLYSDNIQNALLSGNSAYRLKEKELQIALKDNEILKQASEIERSASRNKLMTALAIFLLLITLLIWFLYQQRQKRKDQEIVALKREQQVKTLESLIEGEEKERLRVAKELHDGINVDLSAIKYKLTSLLEKNNEVINEAVSMIDKSCEQVRAISHNLVPPALKNFSLVETLQDYCSTTNSIHDQEVSFQTIGAIIEIPKKAEVNVFRIVQELVNNSLKHAEASEIHVQLSYQEGNTIQLTIEDNGKGFNTEEITKNGIGLANINSRVAYLNGKLDVTSDTKGTSYVIDINTEQLI